MKICFFTSDCVLPTKGGVERVVYNLSHIFQSYEYEIIIISSSTYIKNIELPFKEQYSLVNCSNIFSDENQLQLDFLFSKANIDVIINASHQAEMFSLAFFMKNKFQCRLISTLYCTPDAVIKGLRDDIAYNLLHENYLPKKIYSVSKLYLFYPYRKWVRLKYLRSKYRYQYLMSDAFILESASYKPSFLKIIGIKDDSKLFAFSNPLSKFNPIDNNCRRKKQLLFIARMNIPQKRPDRMIKIWKNLYNKFPDWELLMIGDGQDKSILIDYVARNKIKNIRFIPSGSLDLYYSESEILCMTSTYEGFGLVLIESQQNGVIPIAFDSYNAVHDIIQTEYNGILVQPFSLSKYRKKLAELMNSEKLREQYRRNIMKTDWSDFAPNKVGDAWSELF